MKVLSVVPVMGIGGAEAVVAALATDARARGDQVSVGSAGGFRMAALAACGVTPVDLSLGSRRPAELLRAVRAVGRCCRADPPDLVHAHNVKATVAVRLAIGRDIPVLTTLHGVPPGAYGVAAHLLAHSADRIAAVSPYVADELVRHGCPVDRVVVVPNAVPPPAPRDRLAARRRLGIPAEAPVAVCLARMAPQKRHDLLVEAWRTLPAEAVLLLAGDGPTRPAVADAVRIHGLTGRVRLLGERHDVDWLLAAADVAVLPTDWEGLPISVLEAMGAGVAVIVSRVGDVTATLADGVRTVEPGRAAPLAQALVEVLDDSDGRRRLAARGRALVAEKYGAGLMLDRYRELYEELGRAGRPVGTCAS
jgi:glycosyltransferase involved in cell wall biosynthesis